MKKLFFVTVVFLGLTVAHGQTTFQKTYGGTYLFNEAYSLQETNDSGFIVTGYTRSFGAGLEDVYLIKTSPDGSLQWANTFGGTNVDYGTSVRQTNDMGFIVSGYTSFGVGWWDVYLIKTASDGTLQWSQTFGGTGDDKARSVEQTNDGGFIITGQSSSFGAGDNDIYLIKKFSDGTLQWAKTYGGTDGDYGLSAKETNDGGFIITGIIFGFGSGGYLIKTSSDGTLQWSKVFGGTGGGVGYSVQQTNDGGFILTGSSGNGAGYSDIYLVKTASDGNLQWEKTYGGWGYDYGQSVRQTNDGGYIIGGYTNSFTTNGFNDFYLLKTDSNGVLLWSKTYGETNGEDGFSAEQTKDGGFIIAGIINFGVGHNNFYLVKTDNNGNSGCNETNPNTIVTTPSTTVINPSTQSSSGGIVSNPPTQTGSGGTTTTFCYMGINDVSYNNLITIFPNPFSTQTTLHTDNHFHNATFTVYNSQGKRVKQMTNISGQTVTISRDNLPRGLYFIRLTTPSPSKGEGWGEVVATGKLIVTD